MQVFHLITSYYGYVPQASQARVASMYEEELDLQHPLYAVHGYDEKQVSWPYFTYFLFPSELPHQGSLYFFQLNNLLVNAIYHIQCNKKCKTYLADF